MVSWQRQLSDKDIARLADYVLTRFVQGSAAVAEPADDGGGPWFVITVLIVMMVVIFGVQELRLDIEDAIEVDVDALCDGEKVWVAGIMQQ